MRCLQEVADVVVQVCWFACGWARRDFMNVHIKDFIIKSGDAHNAALLLCFSQGNAQGTGLAICVPARLQPAPQLAVQSEQSMRALRMEQPG